MIRLTGVTVPVLLTVNVFGLGWIYVILATVLILSTIFVLFLPETKVRILIPVSNLMKTFFVTFL